MKRIYIIIATIAAIAISAVNAYGEELTAKAEKAYSADKYSEALALYEQAAANEGTSSALMYNIGNCHYRLGHPGKAILYYERALNIDPTNADARSNLEFVKSKITDNTDVDESNIIVELFRKIRDCSSSNGWATIAIVTFLVFLAAIALYVFGSSVLQKKIGFFGAIVLLIIVIFANGFAYNIRNRIEQKRYAIITVPTVVLSTSPRQPKGKTEEAFILNEGTKIYILDSVANKDEGIWYDIKADDSHRAWINGVNIEKI